jgi:transcriptional regulator with XRE-family HTH domain
MKKKRLPPRPEPYNYSLRELRRKAGLSIQEVAMQTGIAYSTLQSLETGRGVNFNILTKQKLADFYRVPLRRLFPETDELMNVLRGRPKQAPLFTANKR